MNSSVVRDPRWSGAAGEYAVVVSRGEPKRTDDEVATWVVHQVGTYLSRFTGVRLSETAVAELAALVVDEHCPYGAGFVALTREHLLAYVESMSREGNRSG